jgi:hypothetical protein
MMQFQVSLHTEFCEKFIYYQVIRSGYNATLWNKMCETDMGIKQELQWLSKTAFCISGSYMYIFYV